MKTYKKGKYIAKSYTDTSGGSDLCMINGAYKDSRSTAVSLDFLITMGFEEIPEEPVQEIPEWFEEYLDSVHAHDTEECLTRTEMYQIFLKHYPQKEELPVEEIIQKMKIAWREPGIGSDIRHSFEDILRTYTIKQDAVQHLDTKEYKSLYGWKLSQEAIDKGVEALRGDCLQPLDVEKIAIMILTNLDIPVWPYWKSIAQCTVESILSNYWTPTQPLEPLDAEKVISELLYIMHEASDENVNGRPLMIKHLSKYWIPKITEQEIEGMESVADWTIIIKADLLELLDSKWLLDKTK